MKRKTSSTENYIYNTLYKVLTLLTPLITAPYLARVIGNEGVGIFSYTYSIAYNFMLVAKLGLTNYGSRCVARVRDDEKKLAKTFSEIYGLQIITTVVASALYFVFVVNFLEEYRTICLVNSLYVISIAIDIDWLFYGLEKFKMTSIRNAVIKLLTVVAILVFVKDIDDLIIYIIIMAVSDALKYLFIWVNFRSCTRFVKIEFSNLISHLKPDFILFIPVIATSVYRSMDKIMLGSMSTMAETGIYENSEKIVYMLLGFITSLEMVMMPKMSNLIEHGKKDEAQKNIRYSMMFVVWLASAMAFGVTGISERFVPVFYGDGFLGVIELLPSLAITLIFIGWANVIRTQYVMPNGKDHLYVISTVIGAVVNFCINFALIPFLQAEGAVIGTIVAELSVAVYLSYIVRKELPIGNYFKNSIMFVFIGIIMAIIVFLIGKIMNNSILSLFVQICVGGAIYVLLSLIYIRIRQPDLSKIILSKIKVAVRR